jgi:hypothetical protein
MVSHAVMKVRSCPKPAAQFVRDSPAPERGARVLLITAGSCYLQRRFSASCTMGLVQSCSLILRLGSSGGARRNVLYMPPPVRLVDPPRGEAVERPDAERPVPMAPDEVAEDELPLLPAAGPMDARPSANTRTAALT